MSRDVISRSWIIHLPTMASDTAPHGTLRKCLRLETGGISNVRNGLALSKSGNVQQPANDAEHLKEMVHLIVDLDRIGIPELMANQASADGEQRHCQRDRTGAPTQNEQHRTTYLDDDHAYQRN